MDAAIEPADAARAPVGEVLGRLHAARRGRRDARGRVESDAAFDDATRGAVDRISLLPVGGDRGAGGGAGRGPSAVRRRGWYRGGRRLRRHPVHDVERCTRALFGDRSRVARVS